MKKYYEVSEELAKRSKQAYSFDEYVEGSATEDYCLQVDEAYELAMDVLEENKEKAMYYADMYAKKLADITNKINSINASCPSVMIVGAGNYPMKKHEKQMERLNKAFKEYDAIKGYLEKIRNLNNHKPRTEKQGTAKEIDLSNDYFEVVQNEEMNRLQLLFDEKPSDEKRAILKSRGFRWSPKNQVWQRQLTKNALYSTKLIISEFNKIEG